MWECSLAGLSSTSVDPRYFKANPFTFAANRMYAVSVIVVDNFGYNNSAAITVHVGGVRGAAADRRRRPHGRRVRAAHARRERELRPRRARRRRAQHVVDVRGGSKGACACAGALLDQAANELDLAVRRGHARFGVLARKFADGEWRNATARAS